jgi:hypothetical protein
VLQRTRSVYKIDVPVIEHIYMMPTQRKAAA